MWPLLMNSGLPEQYMAKKRLMPVNPGAKRMKNISSKRERSVARGMGADGTITRKRKAVNMGNKMSQSKLAKKKSMSVHKGERRS